MNEKQPILDLHIIALKQATVIEVIEKDWNALGFNRPFTKTKDNSIEEFMFDVFDELEQDSEPIIRLYTADVFNSLCKKLTTFAEQGAFWRDEKPVPRIELEDRDNYKLVTADGDRILLHRQTMKCLEQIVSESIPIYKPRKFKSEWVREFPREWTFDELLHRPVQDSYDKCATFSINLINNIQSQSNFEVWRFRMWESE